MTRNKKNASSLIQIKLKNKAKSIGVEIIFNIKLQLLKQKKFATLAAVSFWKKKPTHPAADQFLSLA